MIARTLALFSTLLLLSSSAPVDVLGSKHVVYLAACAPDSCPIGICDPGDFNILAAGYFANGSPKLPSATPTTLGVFSVFDGGAVWEGGKKTVRLGSTGGSLAADIQAGAKKLPHGEIVGEATLTTMAVAGGTEPFVCFRDGVTKFKASYEGDKYTCTADYFCPSLDVGM